MAGVQYCIHFGIDDRNDHQYKKHRAEYCRMNTTGRK